MARGDDKQVSEQQKRFTDLSSVIHQSIDHGLFSWPFQGCMEDIGVCFQCGAYVHIRVLATAQNEHQYNLS